jgi:hypothetical protein
VDDAVSPDVCQEVTPRGWTFDGAARVYHNRIKCLQAIARRARKGHHAPELPLTTESTNPRPKPVILEGAADYSVTMVLELAGATITLEGPLKSVSDIMSRLAS